MNHSGKRLLVVTQHFWPENFRINDIVDGFIADGIEVDVLCGLPNYPKGEWFTGYSAAGPFEETHHGAHIYRCKEIPRTGNTGARIFLNYISWPWHARWALGRLPGGYDAVFCFNTSPVLMSWPAACAAKKFKAPLINYVLDIWPENLYSVLPVKNKFLRAIAQKVSDALYRRADKLIAMSNGLEKRLRTRMQDDTAKQSRHQYAVIPQYCEDFYAQPGRDEALCNRFSESFVVMFAGNFSPAQSLDTMLNALSLARGKAAPGVDLQLVLVGDGMSRQSLEELAKRLQLQNCVTFYGSVKPQKIPALAGAADALLVSLSDSPDLGLTVPAKLASCMAAAKPLLVSISGEGALAAKESGGALVSEACDVQTLAQNLLQLASTPDAQLQQMGKNAFDYYQTHYRRDLLLRQLEDFIFGPAAM